MALTGRRTVGHTPGKSGIWHQAVPPGGSTGQANERGWCSCWCQVLGSQSLHIIMAHEPCGFVPAHVSAVGARQQFIVQHGDAPGTRHGHQCFTHMLPPASWHRDCNTALANWVRCFGPWCRSVLPKGFLRYAPPFHLSQGMGQMRHDCHPLCACGSALATHALVMFV